jgi:hypothetical protein
MTTKQGYKKYAAKPEPEAAETSEPKAGYKKWQEKFAAKDFDGNFASESEDALGIDKDLLKAYAADGLDFKWMRESIFGWRDDKNIARHMKNGWTPVEPGDLEGIENVREGGLQLVARPKQISDKARAIQEAEAVQPVHVMRARAGEGIDVSMPGGGEHSTARSYNKIKVSREGIQVPDDRNRILD